MQFRNIIFQWEWPFIKMFEICQCPVSFEMHEICIHITQTSSLQPLEHTDTDLESIWSTKWKNGRMGEWMNNYSIRHVTMSFELQMTLDQHHRMHSQIQNEMQQSATLDCLSVCTLFAPLRHCSKTATANHLSLRFIVECWQIWGH